MAERRYRAKCQVDIGPDAVVRFRHLGKQAPRRLTIGNGTIFQATISADRLGAVIQVGKNTFVGNSHFVCAERIEIGDDVLIAWGCTIVDHDSHSTSWTSRKNDVADARRGAKDWSGINISPTIVRDKAWIGFNTIILKGVVIGEGAVVGAGSVVTKSVAPHTIVGGNPAKVIRNCAES